ncbi:hypothetical protein D6C90_09996, partial [Aureobasidium pullulans]
LRGASRSSSRRSESSSRSPSPSPPRLQGRRPSPSPHQAARRALPQAPQTPQIQPPQVARRAPPQVARRAPPQVARRASSPSPVRVPDPPEFDNKIPFAPWLVKMKLKLNMELSHVNEQTKMDYILSRTSGSVFERLLLRVPGYGHDHGRRSDLVFKDSADCLYQLNEWYSDRHRESHFYRRFQDLVGYLNLPESLLVLKLKYKLNDRFGYYINDGKIYASVRELVDRGDRLDADIHLLPDDPYTTDDDHDHDHDHDLGSEASHDSHESHDLVASALEACCFSWYASSMVYRRDPCRFSYAHCLSL